MKGKKQLLSVFLILFLCIVQIKPVEGSGIYNVFIKNTLSRNIGIAKTGKNIKSTIKGNYWGGWCKTNGIVSTYETDLNNDRKKELLIFYLKKEKREPSYGPVVDKRALHMALYAKKGDSIKKMQDITLDEDFDMYMGAWSNAFIYEYKGTKYIVYQNSLAGTQGHLCSWYVFSVNKRNQFVVKKAIVDPGYSIEITLYRLPSSIPASKIAFADPTDGKVIYKNEMGIQNNSAYIRALKRELNRYGISLKRQVHFLISYTFLPKVEMPMMTADRSGKTNLFTIKGTGKYGRGVLEHTCRITDYTKVKNKL